MGEPGGGNANPNLDVRIDIIRGRGGQSVYGRRLNASNGDFADVWSGTEDSRPLPLAPTAMFVVSDGADELGVAGAQLMVVTFIDESGDWRKSDLLAMDTTNPVAITYKPDDGILGDRSCPPRAPTVLSGESEVAAIFRVQDAYVVTALGSTVAVPRVYNVGVISVIDAGAIEFEAIPIGACRSRSAAFHVPRNKTARLTSAQIGTAKGGGTAFIGSTAGLGTAWQLLPIAGLDATTVLLDSDPAATLILPRSDIAGVILPEMMIDVTFLMQFRLVPIQ